MELLEIQKNLDISYSKLNRYSIRSGYNFTDVAVGNFIKGEVKKPTEEMVEAVELAFTKACEEWKPSLLKEVEAWFEQYRGGGGDDA